MTRTELLSGYVHYGTDIDLPPELDKYEIPTDFESFWATVRPLMEQVVASHQRLNTNLKTPYASFKMYMLNKGGRGGRYPQWTRYDAQFETDSYIVWFLKRWSSFSEAFGFEF